MSASSAKTVEATALITYRPGPSGKGKNAESWRAAGYQPADHIGVEFPPDLMPDVAYMITTIRGGARALMLTLTPDDLSDDLLTGAELVQAEPGRRGSVVTRDEAAARFAKWQTKAQARLQLI